MVWCMPKVSCSSKDICPAVSRELTKTRGRFYTEPCFTPDKPVTSTTVSTHRSTQATESFWLQTKQVLGILNQTCPSHHS